MSPGHDGGDRATIHVREMGVVAAVIVVVAVFVIVVEADLQTSKVWKRKRNFRSF